MKDYIVTEKTHRITIPSMSKNSINVWFWGDVHRDAKACDVERWKWFLNKASKDDPEYTYYMGMGDYHDFASASERKKIKAAFLHETTEETIEDGVEKRNRAFAMEIKQMRGKLLGMMEGNHTWILQNGTTSTEDLANRMGCEYLGYLTHLSLIFREDYKTARTQTVDIVACHGKAGGKTAGITLNQVDDLRRVFPAADIYVMGHDHERGAWPKDVLIRKNGGLKQHRQFLCRSGAFLKGYTPGTSSYSIGRIYRPSDLGALKLNIAFHRDVKDGQDRVITDITATI